MFNQEKNIKKEGSDDYFNSDAISQSDIKLYLKSPELFNVYKNGQYKNQPTEEMKFGSLVDLLLFEPELLSEKYYIIPNNQEIRKSTKDGKKFWEDIGVTAKDKTVISEDEYSHACKLVKSLKYNETANNLIFTNLPSFNQLEIYTVYNGYPIKGKLDKLIFDLDNKKITIVDYKTTSSEGLHNFKNTVKKYGYHIQDSFYTKLIENCKNNPFIVSNEKARNLFLELYDSEYTIEFIFVVQYTKFPYHVNCVKLSDRDFQNGLLAWTHGLDSIINSYKTGIWKSLNKNDNGVYELDCGTELYDIGGE